MINFCGVKLKNLTVLCSGIMGSNFASLQRVFDNGCGLPTMKSIGPVSRDGHNNPTVLELDHGLINAVGLPSPGFQNMSEEWAELAKRKFPVIASIYGGSVLEFKQVARFVATQKPDFIEANISCPNAHGKGSIFGVDPKLSFKVISGIKKVIGKIPLIAKLTPQAINIGEIAKSCEAAGASAISAINAVGPGMVINIDVGRPVLTFKKGGLSGPAIKPVAVRCVYDIYQNVKIPIIGMGGVSNGRDAIEMMMAGASLVGVGSAVLVEGMGVFKKINKEILKFLKKNKYKNLKNIIGLAHK